MSVRISKILMMMQEGTFGGAAAAAVAGLEELVCGARGAITYAAISCSTFIVEYAANQCLKLFIR